MVIKSGHSSKKFLRKLALMAAVFIVVSLLAGTLGVLADDSIQSDGFTESVGSESAGSGNDTIDTDNGPDIHVSPDGDTGDTADTEEIPDSGDDESLSSADASDTADETGDKAGGETNSESDIGDSKVTDSNADNESNNGAGEADDAEPPETEEFELSCQFSQFVTSAELIGPDGNELPEHSVTRLAGTVRLRLTIGLDAQAIAAIYADSDKEYFVCIPEKLAAEAGLYELKSDGKLLGTLRADAEGACFIFNADGDSLFTGDIHDDINDLRLDIPCGFDGAAIGGDTEFTVDLGEYNHGKSYAFELVQALTVSPMIIPVNPAKDFTQFVDSVKLVENATPNAPEISDPYLMNSGGPVHLRFDFKSLDGSDLSAIKALGTGYQYAVPIPDMLKMAMNADGKYPLEVAVDSTKKTLGWMYIDASGTSAYFVFNTEENDFFNGEVALLESLWLDIECKLDPDKIGDNDRTADIDMKPYDDTKEYHIVMSDRTPDEPNMLKSGKYDEKTGLYEWTVTVMAPETTDDRDWLKDIKLTDTTGSNHKIWGDITLKGKEGTKTKPHPDVNETYAPKSSAPVPDGVDGYYTPTNNGFGLELAGPYTGTLTITYYTALTEAALQAAADNADGTAVIDLPNSAAVEYGENKTLSAGYTLKNTHTSFLEKDGKFLPGERAMEWTVTVDTLGQGFSWLALNDLMSDGIKHDRNWVKINGSPVTLTDENFYTDTGNEVMLIELFDKNSGAYVPNSGGKIITITYRTTIPDNYINYLTGQTKDIENDAWLDFGWLGGPGDGTGGVVVSLQPPTVNKQAPAVAAPVLKEALSYDTGSRLITWKITVNSNRLSLTNVVVTDTVTSKDTNNKIYEHQNLAYVENSLRIGGNPSPGLEAAFNAAFSGTAGTVTIPALDEVEATFLVRTEVTDNDFLNSNKENKDEFIFKNEMAMTAKSGEDNVSGSDSAEIEPSNNILTKTAGDYNYADHTMEWTIIVNADKITPFKGAGSDDVIATDTIPNGQKLVAGSVTINGTAASFIPDPADNTKLTISLGDLSGKMATIKYKTVLDPVLNNVTKMLFKNDAEASTQYGTPTAHAEKEVPVIPLKKSAVSVVRPNNSTALVTYRVLINQSNEPMSPNGVGAATIDLTDTLTPTANVTVDVDLESVVLHNAAIDAKGNFTASGAPISISKTFANPELNIKIPASGGLGACVLEYDVVVRSKDGSSLSGKLNNGIEFVNFAVADGGGESGCETSLESNSGSGGNISRYLNVQIVITDEKVVTMPVTGTKFGLYLSANGDPNNGGVIPIEIQTAETDRDGKIKFSLLMPSGVDQDNYYIKEIAPAPAYVLPNQNGYINVKSLVYNDSIKTYTCEVKNEREEFPINFGKAYFDHDSGEYKKLVDATMEFTLTKDEEGGYTNSTALPTIENKGTGVFFIDGLKWGIYTLKEETHPDGFAQHTGTYRLEVKKPVGNAEPVVTITKNNDGTYPQTAFLDASNTANPFVSDHLPAIVNEKGSISLVKVDKDTGATITTGYSGSGQDAKFKLEIKATGGTYTAVNGKESVSTADNGTLTFYDLDYGETYRIKEISPPTGYDDTKLTDQPDAIWVSGDFIISLGIGKQIHYTSLKVPNMRKDMYSFSFYKHVKTYAGSPEPATKAVDIDDAEFTIYRNYNGTTVSDPVCETSTIIPKTFKPGISGKVTFDGLAFGEYYIVETKAPVGYALPVGTLKPVMKAELKRDASASDPIVTITDLTNSNATISGTGKPFVNEKGSCTITKADNLFSAAGNLTGAEFEVSAGDGETHTGKITSGNSVTIEGLTLGKIYTITETKAPAGYKVNSTPLTFTLPDTGVKANIAVKRSVMDDRSTTGEFSFTKIGENPGGIGNVNLPGAVFKLEFVGTQPDGGQILPLPWVKESGHYYQTITSSDEPDKGKVSFTNLPYGSYKATEVSAPDGYPKNTAAITFAIAQGSAAASGAQGLDGNATDGYTFKNPLGKYTLTKTDGADNTVMSGVEFNLYKKISDNVTSQVNTSPYTTNGSGVLEITGLTLGEYELRETVHAGYIIPASVTFTLSDTGGQSGYVKSGSLQNKRATVYSFGFKKEDDRNTTLSGAKFGLYTDAACTAAVAVTGFDQYGKPTSGGNTAISATSANDGTVKFSGLAFGIYFAKETVAPIPTDSLDSYAVSDVVLKADIKPDGSYTIVKAGGNGNVSNVPAGPVGKNATSGLIVHNKLLGSVTVKKTDVDDSSVKLQNAGFTIYDAAGTGAPVKAEQFTDANGEVTFTGLELDKDYVLKETTSPAYYSINTNGIPFKLEYEKSGSPAYHIEIPVTNEKPSDKFFTFWKMDNLFEPVENVDFEIRRSGDTVTVAAISTETSGDTGMVEFKNLKAGTYEVREKTAPESHIKSETVLRVVIGVDAAVTITPQTGNAADVVAKQNGDNYPAVIPAGDTIVINNRNPIYSFGFIKEDGHGNKLNGAEFGLYSDSNCTAAVTGSNGAAITAESKTEGGNEGIVKFVDVPFGTYYVEEISAPTGGADSYATSDAVLKADIASDGSYTISYADGTGPENAARGDISGFTVENELLGSITVIKQDKFNQEKLEGVTFELWDENAASKIRDAVTTNSNGEVKFTDLNLGEYTLIETSTLTGYTSHADIPVEVVYAAAPLKYHVSLTVENERSTDYSFEFLKQDSYGKDLPDAVFGIVRAADNGTLDSVGGADFTIITAASGSDGKVKFDNLSFGRYFIREITAPANHLISNAVLQADIKEDGTVVYLGKANGSGLDEVIASGGYAVVINYRKPLPFSFGKTALNTGNGLAGAVFTATPVQGSDGKTVVLRHGTSNMAVSGSNGKVTFNLPYGAYLIEEISAPANYVKSNGKFVAETYSNGNIAFREHNGGTPNINVVASSGVTVVNAYNPPAPPPAPDISNSSSSSSGSPSSSGGSGSTGSSGDSGGSTGWRASRGGLGSPPPVTAVPQAASPQGTTAGLPPFFPTGTVVSDPVVETKTNDYTITRQTITTPDGDEYDYVIIEVKNPNGVDIGEIPPPPPREGYEFGGWYLDPEMKTPYRPGDKLPPGTERIYGKWYLSESYYDDPDKRDNKNPGTEDGFPYKSVAASAALALLVMALTRPALKERRKTTSK